MINSKYWLDKIQKGQSESLVKLEHLPRKKKETIKRQITLINCDVPIVPLENSRLHASRPPLKS